MSGSTPPDLLTLEIYNSAGQNVGGFGYNDGTDTLTLTSTGTYTVLVPDRSNSATGNYTICLVYATPNSGCGAIPLSCGEVITNVISDPALQNVYSIAGTAGAVIHLTSVSKSGGVEPDIEIYNSAGQNVGGFGYNDGTDTLTLTSTGTYT